MTVEFSHDCADYSSLTDRSVRLLSFIYLYFTAELAT